MLVSSACHGSRGFACVSRSRSLPAKLEARAQVNHWLLFTVTELEQPLWRIARHTALYPKDKRLPDEVTLARKDFQDMAAVTRKVSRPMR